jgi:murein DD-endopeptidase MepM/ murein hydrolase activator NlpD
MSKEKGFSCVYIPKRGSSKSFHISFRWLYLLGVILVLLIILVNQFANKYFAYAKEYATMTNFSVEEKQKLMADELFSIQQEISKTRNIVDKTKEKLQIISTLDKESRNRLGLIKKDLAVDSFFKDINKNAKYITTTDFNLQEVFNLKKYAQTTLTKIEEQEKNLDVVKASSEEYKTIKAQTPEGLPVPGYISPGFGWRIHPIFHIPDYHTGVDISESYGYPIKATADGIVNESGWAGGYGYAVKIYHRDGIETLYAHCSKLLVNVGERVKRGQTIANIGDSGTATNAHIHYEIRIGGKPIDPEGF